MQQSYTTRDRSFWFIIIILGLSSLFIFATMYSFQSILPLLTKEFEIPISTASFTMSITTIGLIIGLLVIGFLSDRYGRKYFIVSSLTLTTILLFVIPFFPNFYIIILLRFIQGFSFAGLLSTALAYMAEEIHPRYFSFATTLYIAANSLGGMAGRFITSYLAESFSWQATLFIIGLFGLFISIIVIFLLPISKFFNPTHNTVATDIKSFFVHLKNPALLLMFGLGVILQTAFTGMWTFLPFHLTEPPYDLTLKAIAYFYLAYSLGIIGAPIAGLLAEKYSLRSLRIAGILILSGGALFALNDSLIMIGISLCLLCLGFFISHSIASTSVSQTATHHKGSASSLYLVSYYIGVSIGSSSLTPLWNNFGWNGIVLFSAIIPFAYISIVLSFQHIHTKKPIR